MRFSELDAVALLKWLDCCDRVGKHRREHGPRMTPAALKAWTPVFAVEATDDEVASAVGVPAAWSGMPGRRSCWSSWPAAAATTPLSWCTGGGDDRARRNDRDACRAPRRVEGAGGRASARAHGLASWPGAPLRAAKARRDPASRDAERWLACSTRARIDPPARTRGPHRQRGVEARRHAPARPR